MANNISKIDWNWPGFDALRNCKEVKNLLSKEAEKVARRAPGNYETEVLNRPTRAVAFIREKDAATHSKNLKTNGLIKAASRGD